MLSEKRWNVEALIMQENFPNLWPFETGDKFGFEGHLAVNGRRSYEIVVEASKSQYPMVEPRIYMNPHPERHHWIRTGGQPYLCYQRDSALAWNPARSTLASCVAVAIKYIKEFGGSDRNC